jgi:predicted secreted protein
MISKTKAKSEMKKEHKLWEKASITDLKKSEKVMIVCPHCDKEFDVSQFEKLTYEQGKIDAYKEIKKDGGCALSASHNCRCPILIEISRLEKELSK